MRIYLKMGDIKGEAISDQHKEWIDVVSMSQPIMRSIPQGAVGQARSRGDTTMGDITLVREVDKSSPGLAEACAKGKFFDEIEIHLTNEVKGKHEPWYKIKLSNVIATGYNFHAVANRGDAGGKASQPTEEVTVSFTKIAGTYIVMDNDKGVAKGNIPWSYEPGKGNG